MGMSSSEMLVSEKIHPDSMDFDFLVKCIDNNVDGDVSNHIQDSISVVNPAQIGEDNDGFKTPTSSDRREVIISPMIPQCPPAPRKRRPSKLLTLSRKRKVLRHQEVLLDMSDEIQSFFAQTLRTNFGGKIKRLKGAHQDGKSPYLL